jgi:TonB family protein
VDPAAELPPLVKDPAIVHFVEAVYPQAAKDAGLQATVKLLIDIDEKGAVTNVSVLEPVGNGFDEAALEAVRQFVFSPAEDATGPVPVEIEFGYGFVLDVASKEGAVPATDPSASTDPAAATAPAEAPVNLDGVLVEMGTRRPLAGFLVRVEPLGVEATTDDEGRFSFRGVPDGDVHLRVVRPNYDPVDEIVTVAPGQATTVKLWIRGQSYQEQGIVGTYKKETAEVTQHTITMDEVRRVPGTFGDPIRVVQTLPGAARAPFGTGLLIIRGANPEDSAVYVDGIRIPYIYHLGGFESVINPDLVGAVDYLPGGYGVSFGRTLGGAVEARTITEYPDRVKVNWSTDILDSGASVVGRAGKQGQHGFGFAARRSYIDVFLPYILRKSDFVVKPRWWDYQAKYQYLGGQDTLSLLAFGFQDDLDASAPSGTVSTQQDAQGGLGTSYYTHRIMLTWEHPIGDDLTFRLIPSVGRDFASINVGDALRVDQGQWVGEIRTELPWQPSEHFKLTPGVDFIGGLADFQIQLPIDPSQLASYDPLAEHDPYTLSGTQTGWGPDPYLDAQIRPLKDPEKLLLTPGLRFTYYTIPGELTAWGFDPRFSFRWAATKGTRIKGSAGIYHQPPQPYQSYRPDDQRVELDLERALSSSLGVEQDVSSAIHGSVEVFYRWSDKLVQGSDSFSDLNDQYFENAGFGRAYGVELLLRHDPVGNLFGWVSYTLSRSERKDSKDGDWYLFDYDQTHILVGTAGYKLPFDIEVSAKIQYTTGNPTTPYSLGVYDVDQDSYSAYSTGAYNSERLPDYFSASARVDKLFTFKTWQLDLYVDFLNAIHGVNPEFELYNYDYTESTYISSLPFIPCPGFEAKVQF